MKNVDGIGACFCTENCKVGHFEYDTVFFVDLFGEGLMGEESLFKDSLKVRVCSWEGGAMQENKGGGRFI